VFLSVKLIFYFVVVILYPKEPQACVVKRYFVRSFPFFPTARDRFAVLDRLAEPPPDNALGDKASFYSKIMKTRGARYPEPTGMGIKRVSSSPVPFLFRALQRD